ncbi:peptidylprolyl isomerase [Sphingomonas sp. 35-24ZXX]|uniref:peptidylprolyl isomerase n=1 Tax=Sphingomonas sp. 35-24ZXX TaxID=1545915 RepID=UPI00053BD96C|nr:peptidylprolyl isomerase [Sphingomonas sp. 35-24ZXX]
MISFIRSFFQSKIGLAVSFIFLALIAVAFAASDVTGGATFGGVGSEAVAEISGEEIGTGEFSTTVTNAFGQVRQQNPQLDMAAFDAQGGIDGILEQMVGSYAAAAFADSIGLGASKRLVDSEIAGIQAFKGADGRFDETLFRNALAQQGLTEARVRIDIQRGLLSDQLTIPATFGAKLSQQMALPYAGLILEGREGQIAFVPSAAFAPKTAPTQAQLQTFLTRNAARYRIPERRVLRYATFLTDSFRDQVKVSDAEIAALYKKRSAEFAATEKRDVEQLIVPTEAAAKAIAAKINGGASMATAAKEAGLEPIDLGLQSKEDLTETASSAVANAVFAAASGKVATPARSPLGWHVVRVDSIAAIAGRSLTQVRNLLENEIAQDKLRQTVSDFTANLEDRIADGASLADIAKDEGLTLQVSPELLANGQAPGKPDFAPIGAYQAMLPIAFGLEEDAGPQLVEVQQGKEFAVFEVQDIKRAAPPPLASIRDRVARDWALAQGLSAAKTLADSIAKARNPAALAKAVSSASVPLPGIEQIATNRQTIMQQQDRVPPPVALLFSMAEGTTKVLEGPDRTGWFVVHLTKINRGDASKVPQLLALTQTQLGQVVADEYGQQLIAAMKADAKVQRNPKAIKRVKDQLTGRNQEN